MDQALKQRLIGAAVLVALAVIFVPLLLDVPEQAPPASTLPLEMPPTPDAPLQTREIQLDLPGQSATAPSPSASSAGSAADNPPASDDPNRVVAVDAVQAAPPPVEPDAAQVSETARETPRDTPRDTPPPSQTSPPPAASANVVSTAERSPPSVTAPPVPATPPAPPSASAPVASSVDGRFLINLGSFGNRENAAGLRQRLQARGVNVLVDEVSLSSGSAQRLRAGPYRSRGEAESALLLLSRAEPGNAFAVVELDAQEATASVARGAFAVQVGALKDETEANALRDRIRKAGYAAYVARAQTDAGVLWRVRAGPELDRARALRVRDELKVKLQLDGMVVAHP